MYVLIGHNNANVEIDIAEDAGDERNEDVPDEDDIIYPSINARCGYVCMETRGGDDDANIAGLISDDPEIVAAAQAAIAAAKGDEDDDDFADNERATKRRRKEEEEDKEREEDLNVDDEEERKRSVIRSKFDEYNAQADGFVGRFCEEKEEEKRRTERRPMLVVDLIVVARYNTLHCVKRIVLVSLISQKDHKECIRVQTVLM